MPRKRRNRSPRATINLTVPVDQQMERRITRAAVRAGESRAEFMRGATMRRVEEIEATPPSPAEAA